MLIVTLLCWSLAWIDESRPEQTKTDEPDKQLTRLSGKWLNESETPNQGWNLDPAPSWNDDTFPILRRELGLEPLVASLREY